MDAHDKAKVEKHLRRCGTPPMTKEQRDKAVAKDPDIRGVNRQESRG